MKFKNKKVQGSGRGTSPSTNHSLLSARRWSSLTLGCALLLGQGCAGPEMEELELGTSQQGITATFQAEARDRAMTLDDGGSTPSSGSIVSWSWNYGDGYTTTGRTPRVHTYASAGTYTITLTVTDSGGYQASSSQTVTVSDKTAGSYTPNDANTGVPGPVQDRYYVLNLEKSNKSSTNTPTPNEETLRIGWTGTAYTFTRNGSAVSIPSEHAYVSDSRLYLDRLHIKGYLTVAAPNVTLRRSVVEGVLIPEAPEGSAPTGVNSGRRLITATDSATTDFIIEDCKLHVPAAVQSGTGVNDGFHHSHAVDGSRFTLRRTEIAGTVDGIQIHRGGGTYTRALIEKNWIHDIKFYPKDLDRTADDATHNDGIQVECSDPEGTTYDGARIVGNVIDMSSDPNLNACLMVTRNACATNGVRFDSNWCDGTVAPINVGTGTSTASITLSANRNRFGPNRATGAVPNKSWVYSTSSKIAFVKSNTSSAAWDNSGTTQQYVYFSFDPPSSVGGTPPSGEANGNIIVEHTRGSQTWGSSTLATGNIGKY
jgi:PKD repeat protein